MYTKLVKLVPASCHTSARHNVQLLAKPHRAANKLKMVMRLLTVQRVPLYPATVPVVYRFTPERLFSTSPPNEPTRVDFSDTSKAYKTKTTRELLRAFFVFKLFQYEAIVTNSNKLFNLGRRLLGETLLKRLVKPTIYAQFVAGEDTDEIKPVVAKLRSQGIRPIFAYAVEDDIGKAGNGDPVELTCDNNTEYTIGCIETAAATSTSGKNDAFAAFKITALAPVKLLVQMSHAVLASHKLFPVLADKPSLTDGSITHQSLHEGLRKSHVRLSESETERLFNIIDTTKSGKIGQSLWTEQFMNCREVQDALKNNQFMVVLTEEEKKQFEAVTRRVKSLAQCAQDNGVRLMVDAEQTYYQPAIRHIAVDMLMPQFNKDRAVIYETQQCYLKDAMHTIGLNIAAAKSRGFLLAVKTVRGAYLDQERALSKEKGYEDPIWPTKEDTDSSYHRVVGVMTEQIKAGKANLMVATHNEATVHFALNRIHKLGLNKEDGSIVFGQQLGMSDHISLTLGSLGYQEYKYMPYGPVIEVIPYLIRRANENKGVLAGAIRERSLLSKELSRRCKRK